MQTFSVLTKPGHAEGSSQEEGGRKLGQMLVPGGLTGGCKCSVHAPAEGGGVFPGRGMVLELSPRSAAPCKSMHQSPLSLRGADLLMPVVRAECPSGDPISSAPAAQVNDLSEI